ncbi:MAG: TonB-dependent receptor [Zoogloeaceae bacterium]|jgi:vitamin B12 transporter|nr:TonB-dependent receptor [Zoogloeaceae bacterium]
MSIQKTTLAALALPVALPFASFSALAQEAGTNLDTIVVTASRQPSRANELLSDVTVVDRQEIENAGGHGSLEDLLARQPGLEIRRTGGLGASTGIFIRGGKSEHVVVLIDGMRVGSATTGTPTWAFLPLQQIERIEILRGAASSLYGSDAIGGVVQVFTRKGEGPFRFDAEAGFGSQRSIEARAGISGSTEEWRYSLRLADQRTDGVSAQKRRNRLTHFTNTSYNPDRDGFHNSSASGNLVYRFAPGHEAGVNFLHSQGWNDYDNNWPDPPGAAGDYQSKQRISSGNLFSRNRLHEKWTSTFQIGRSRDDYRNYIDGHFDSRIRTDMTQYQWQNDIELPVGAALLGVERRIEKVYNSGTRYDEDERRITSYLLGWTGNLGAHRLQLNARSDRNSQYGSKGTGLIAYGYQFAPEWRAHLSYGTAFHAPSFNQLYWPGYGVPDLEPERARNKEIALHYETATHHASLTFYRNDVRDLIASNPSTWVLENVDEARLQGATLAYEGRLFSFDLKASADFQDPRDRGRDKLITFHARRHASVSVGKRHGALDWGVEWQGNGARYRDVNNRERLPGYALVNLRAAYRLAPDWTLFARLNNVFDKEYIHDSIYSAEGANVFLGIRYAPGR